MFCQVGKLPAAAGQTEAVNRRRISNLENPREPAEPEPEQIF
jgi:hypothetical protein